jgi:alkylation response protein AidB-like acyl-CoA dehydrogenase
MDYDDTPEEAAFRAEFRTWLQHNDPGPEPASSDSVAEQAFRMSWHRELYAGGWLGLSWPEQWGGRGQSPLLEAIINEELGVAGIPNSVGPLGWLGRALLLFGNDDQRQRFLMPLLKGESQWCQGFSEPGAGSDLAGISTYAERDGSSYRITGQKLWTSGAQFAEWCMVLVKTDRTIAKHKGISCFVIAMDTPGITVRTLRQSWGGERFCEVFFDQAEALEENRLGDEGDGWKLANTVLSYERGPSEIGVVATWKSELARLAAHANDNPSIATKYAVTKVAVEACRLRLMESLSKRSIGEPPGPGSSVDKLLMIRAEQALGSLEMDVAQASGVTGADRDAGERYIYSRAASIYGGTEQIQKNIVAQRILGLPR